VQCCAGQKRRVPVRSGDLAGTLAFLRVRA